VGHDFEERVYKPSTSVSIHVPRVGHDLIATAVIGGSSVSIHVPRVGHDRSRFSSRVGWHKFQSTCPVWGTTFLVNPFIDRGVFQSTCPVWGTTSRDDARSVRMMFQSTCPVWGTTALLESLCTNGQFQSTCPVWGTTCPARLQTPTRLCFNPRAPCGARPRGLRRACRWHFVSIHVPRVGHDTSLEQPLSARQVSIHVPRVGHDR